MTTGKYTEKNYWEKYWEGRSEVTEIQRTKNKHSINAILDIFDKYLENNSELSVLEIGGAPGQFLMYMNKQFGYKPNSLDYSSVGNKQTLRNFENAKLQVNVFEKDLFADNFSENIPQFDIVYSLGFVEHFNNLTDVVDRHLKLLKPGGILIIGAPNLSGIYQWFLKQLAPKHLAMHNLEAMNDKNWQQFEKQLSLNVLYRNYIGGFEPLVMKKIENKTFWNRLLYIFVTGLMLVFSFNFKFLRKYNTKNLSCYLIGVYKK